MNSDDTPTLLETALGGLLQDIGKFMQRAYGSVSHMDPAVYARQAVILPDDDHGGYSHQHALWTEAFFKWLEDEGLSFPKGINLQRVRDMAVFHHKPHALGALGWLAAEADRLSSGMDRKQKDIEFENEGETHGWDRFIRTTLLSPFSQVDLGLGHPPRRKQDLAELVPDERLLPQALVATASYRQTYARLWRDFTAAFAGLCRQTDNLELFCEGLLSLSERYTWAIPSSPIDLADISLHDHNRTVAAIAACLHAWHTDQGTLTDERAVRERKTPKFRLLAGDLSGIQDTLLNLAHQQVNGVNKILRARSFLMEMLLDAIVLCCRQRLGLTVFNLIHNAGGHRVLLVANVATLEESIAALRAELDAWMRERYMGELTLNLVLSNPFSGNDLMPPYFQRLWAGLRRRLEEAKLEPLRGNATGMFELDYQPFGVCTACNRRPARHLGGDACRCSLCHEEYKVGGWLAKTTAVSWRQGQPHDTGRSVGLFGDLYLTLHEELPSSIPSDLLSGFRLYRGEGNPPQPPFGKGESEDSSFGKGESKDSSFDKGGREDGFSAKGGNEGNHWALRFIAHYVPLLDAAERYQRLSGEARQVQPGEIKTFEYLAEDALEKDSAGRMVGRPLLAVLKADVDRLEMVFGFGLRDADTGRDRFTLSRFAALSRLMDLFFTGYLQQRLRRRFRHTYTVYAGGDDLLLIGPWRQMLTLVEDLNTQFHRYVGNNPNITLSAGLELINGHHPLDCGVRDAAARLQRAKDAGRNRVCLFDWQPIPWERLAGLRAAADTLNAWLRERLIGTAIVYKLLDFAEQRRRAEQGLELACADWRARWGYQLARAVRENPRIPQERKAEVMAGLNRLLGLDEQLQAQSEWASPSIPVSIALYRNRS